MRISDWSSDVCSSDLRDFAHHHGIDLSGMLRAAWLNLQSGEARQGGTTLTQQLARSGRLGLGREQTYTRKTHEILPALLIEARPEHRPILSHYLHPHYHGTAASNDLPPTPPAAPRAR